MSSNSVGNDPCDSSNATLGGVLSIQARIRAMNETLDNVEQRQKKEHHPLTNDTTEHPSTNSVASQNDTVAPVVKRSSVIDIWTMRENQNSVVTADIATKTYNEKETSLKSTSVAKTIASSILLSNKNEDVSRNNVPTNCSSGESPVRVIGAISSWNSKTSSVGQEEKKEDSDNYDKSPVGYGIPIRTVASASPTPPLLPGSNRKMRGTPSAALKSYHQQDQLPVASKSSTYPVVDLTINPSTSSLSTSSGAQHLVTKKSSSLSSNNDKTSNKVALMRDKLMNSTTTTTSNSLPSVSIGTNSMTEIQQQPSYEEKLISAFIQQSPNGTSSPKRQSVVDIWKNRTSTTTIEDNAIDNKGLPSSSAILEAIPSKANVQNINMAKNQLVVSDPGHETKSTEINDEQNMIDNKTESITPVQSPIRNTSVADRWARRVSDQKGTATTRTSDDISVTTQSARENLEAAIPKSRDTAKGIDAFATILTDTFAADRASLLKSTESGAGLDLPPPSSARKGNVTDRYKVAGVSTIVSSTNHMVSPTISSIVKEHAARTHVLPYKNKKENLPEKKSFEAGTIDDMTPSKRNEATANRSDGTFNTYVSNTVVAVVDKQAEKRHNKVTDRWTFNNDCTTKGKDTSDIPVSYGKITDRYKPKSKTSASEPGISRFDSATVAELLKLHAGNTPAGKVRGGIKQHTNDNQRLPLANDARSTYLTSTSEVSQPKQQAKVIEQRTSWKPRTNTIIENDGNEMKILSSITNEQLKASMSPPQDMDGTDVLHFPAKKSSYQVQSMENMQTEPSSEISPAMENNTVVADRWKKRLVHVKEDDQIKTELLENPILRQKHFQTQEENDINLKGRLAHAGCHEVVMDIDEPKRITTKVIDPIIDIGQKEKESLTVSDSNEIRYSDDVVSSRIESAKTLDAAIASSTIARLPQPEKINSESQNDDCIVGHMNASVFEPWTNFGDASHENPTQTTTTTTTSQVRYNVTDLSLQALNKASSIASVAHTSESYARSDFEQNCTTCPSLTNQSVDHEKRDNPKTMGHSTGTLTGIMSATNPSDHDQEKVSSPNPNTVITLSTKKLASDRASNKKRLQQYRGKAKKSLSSKLESTRIENIEDDSSNSVSKPSYHTPNQLAPNIYNSNNSNLDHQNLLQSSGNETGQSSKPEKAGFDRQAIDTIYSSASTTSSSPLASKAEKMLQDRRRRNKVENHASRQLHPIELSARPQTYIVDEERTVCDRNGYFCSDQPRLSTRYNTSTRFIETDTSISAPATTAYDSDSAGSSCNESGTTSGSNSVYRQDRRFLQAVKDSSKRRKHPLKDPPGQLSKDKSVNLSSNSNWDSDWGGNVSMVSMDFDKFVSVVDEQVAAFRDFVGVLTQAKGKPKSRKPSSTNVPVDVEDVAIEVEYVEDSFDYDDPKADLGLCTAPMDDIVRNSLEFSDGSKARNCGGFQLSCNNMLPTGEPSCERKSSIREQSKWNAYV